MALYVGGTSLLLHGDGADGSTLFTDDTGKTVTAYGNAKISTAQSKFGGSSMYFDGAGDWLQVPTNAAFEFGLGDFTIEFWAFLPNITSEQVLVCARDVPALIYSNVMRVMAGKLGWSNGTAWIETATSIPADTWCHIAAVRYAQTLLLFIEGSLGYSGAQPVNIANPRPIYVGASDDPAYRYPTTGYIDDIRITKGVARYTANFTPPTSRLGLDAVYAAIQPFTPYGQPLVKYNPAVGKPVMQAIATDLTDRLPYGIPNTPIVNNVNPWEFKGRGRITGTVKEKTLPENTPLRRLVRLYREPDGSFVKATWSDAVTGEYVFDGVPMQYRYAVTSYDYSNTYRAVIADNLSPTLI